jgi:hypothetical protein
MLPRHTPLWQSPPTPQVLPLAHFVEQPPPQSTSVSVPFFTLSVQSGAWHTLLVHTPDWQSAATTHAFVAAHFVEQLPPQSTSVSVPFFTPSVQSGAWQTLLVHTPL